MTHKTETKDLVLVNAFGGKNKWINLMGYDLHTSTSLKLISWRHAEELLMISPCYISLYDCPSPFSPCSENRAGRLVKLGAGRLSFFLSLEPADSCSERPGAAAYCRAEPQPHPGRFGEGLMHAHDREQATKLEQAPEIKTALTKKSRCLPNLSTYVNIWGIPVWLNGREERHDTKACTV